MSSKTISPLEIALHWVVGLGMIGLITVGIIMTRTENFALYGLHKSVGMLLFVVILWRAVVRLSKGWPENVSKGAAWEHGLARVIHWVLILGTILMPISGMMDSYFAGHGLSIFGLELAAGSADAEGKPLAINASLGELGEEVHGTLGNILIAAIALHVAGALKHQLIDKDGTLGRMLGRA